jgi:hypothetical protein
MNILPMVQAFILVFIAINSGSPCIAQRHLSEPNKNRIQAEVRKTLYDCFAQMKKEGYSAELYFLDASPDFFWIPPRHSLPVSYDSVAALIKKFLPGNRSVENTWDTLHIQPLSETFATYTGRYRAKYTDTTGRVSEYFMLDVGTVVKRKNGWKIISGQTSAIPVKY